MRCINKIMSEIGLPYQQLQIEALMDHSRSRLSSITEEENQVEVSLRTQEALLKIYYELYAISYVKWSAEPGTVFGNISKEVEKGLPCEIENFRPFNQKDHEEKTKKRVLEMKQPPKQSPKKSRILSRQEIGQMIQQKTGQSPKASIERQQQFVQTIQTKKQKELDDTAESNVSISQILQKLNYFDEERTQIKFQIYSEDASRVDHLYRKWSDLHKRMKEVLEVYVNKIGNGSSLLQIYHQMDRVKGSRKVIEGFSEKHLLSKLDTYIQSLFLDQREILLYRSSSEKSRSIQSGSVYGQSKIPRKKLSYN